VSILARQPGQDCRVRDRGPVSMWEDEQRRQKPGELRSAAGGRFLNTGDA
jgi:hypothetical protein